MRLPAAAGAVGKGVGVGVEAGGAGAPPPPGAGGGRHRWADSRSQESHASPQVPVWRPWESTAFTWSLIVGWITGCISLWVYLELPDSTVIIIICIVLTTVVYPNRFSHYNLSLSSQRLRGMWGRRVYPPSYFYILHCRGTDWKTIGLKLQSHHWKVHGDPLRQWFFSRGVFVQNEYGEEIPQRGDTCTCMAVQ